MKSVIEEGFIGVDMPPLPDEIWRGVRLLQLTEPVFIADTESTTSDTFTAWLSPVTEAVTYSGTASLYGIICANNPGNFRDPFGLWSFYSWLYTGNGNASAAEYAAAVEGAADYLYSSGGVRGGYVGVGINKKAPGRGAIAGMGGIRANWTMDQGIGGSLDVGLGLQERGATPVLGLGTMPFVSETVGAGGTYDFYSEECGWRSPKDRNAVIPAVYGGVANRRGGGHFAINSVNNAAIGLNYGPVYFGLLIDPQRVVQNFVDSYHIITGDF